MTKWHVEELSRVYASIFSDVAYAYPTLRGELLRDQTHLERLVEQRGIHTFCVDLPALGKHFDRCLSNGEYTPSHLTLGRVRRRRGQIPEFLRGMLLLIFNESGDLKENYDVQAVFFVRQILFAAKKAHLDCSVEAVRTEVQNFFDIDSSLPEPEAFWQKEEATKAEFAEATPGFQASPRYLAKVAANPAKAELLSTLLVNLDLVSGLITTTLGEYMYSEWRFKHGPGAISEATGPVNKYSFTNWSNLLEREYPLADCGFHNYASWAGNCIEPATGRPRLTSEVPASRLIAVPKTFTKPRLIAAEPSEHQWCQQNLWHYFRTRVERTWIGDLIRFSDQTYNQSVCLEGSKEGNIATIDLSAASDRVTCHAVAQLFRSNPRLLRCLQATRTQYISQNIRSDIPGRVRLRKFSTMGSACTFPVESLLFLALTLASIATKRRMKPSARNFRDLIGSVAVFGDDICCPEDSRELLLDALEVCDFKVNTDKSFWTGKFRESCGIDAIGGVVITPAYWRMSNDGTPESFASNAEVANNFYKKFLVNTASYLDSTNGRHKLPLVTVDSGSLGRKSFVDPTSSRVLKTRWNKDLQRFEVRVPVLRVRAPRLPIQDDSALLQFFTEEPHPSIHWSSGVTQRPRTYLRMGWVPRDTLDRSA